MAQKICYCFNYTDTDIREDLRENNGESTILAKIIAAKQHQGCQCEIHHPEKR